jgi:hypothetical protein
MRRERALPSGSNLVLDLRAACGVHRSLVDGLAPQHEEDSHDPEDGRGGAEYQGDRH